MGPDVSFVVGAEDRRRPEGIAADGNAKQKHVWRARIILESAAGHGTMEIMRRTGVAKPCVWRRRSGSRRRGDGLLRDATRLPGKAPVPEGKVREVLRLTHSAPAGEATHRTLRAMAAEVGLAMLTVRPI